MACRFIRYHSFLLLLFLLITSCQKQLSREESNKRFLESAPESKDFRLGLQNLANHLYNEKWPGKYRFTKPKIRQEEMIVEWENKSSRKTKRKYSNYRFESNIERLGFSCLIAATGPINIEQLLKSNEFKLFTNNLKIYLKEPDEQEKVFNDLINIKMSILKKYKISESKAKLNEKNYNSGIIITTGFYLGFPFYKRITLDSQIYNREEFLNVYLHECGHQLFDSNRKFGKTLKLGFSWVGWAKSTDSWWVVEEKSCNLFAESVLEMYKKDKLLDTKFTEPLTSSTWVFHPLEPNFRNKYAKLFFDESAMLAQLKNARIENRYSTNDAIAKLFRQKLAEKGIKTYISIINKYINLKDVLIALEANPALIQSVKN